MRNTAACANLQLGCDDGFVLHGQDVGPGIQHGRRPLQKPLNLPQGGLGFLLGLQLVHQLIGQQIRPVIAPGLGLCGDGG